MSPGADSAVLSPQVLAELKEYATEVDVDFVRKAVRAIGRCAIKVEASISPWGFSVVPCLQKQCWALPPPFHGAAISVVALKWPGCILVMGRAALSGV